MVEEISDSFSMVWLTSLIAPTECSVAVWMLAICCPISPVAFAKQREDSQNFRQDAKTTKEMHRLAFRNAKPEKLKSR